MAIFRTRSDSQRGQEAARKSNVPVDSVETLRTRARQRLIGAVVLVVLGIAGFSLLFDTQPRPIPVDIEISIPDKDKAERLEMPAASASVAAPVAPVTPTSASAAAPVLPAAPVAATPSSVSPASSSSVQASASLNAKEELMAVKPETKPEVKTAAKLEPKAETKPEKKTEAKPADKPAEKAVAKPAPVDDGAKARAILEGKEPAKESVKTAGDASANGSGRFVVQVGAFADTTKAQEVRVKLERAGLKTYTHVAQTKDGARTRVRVGPFAKREDAEKAAAKIKKIDLPAAILTL